MNKLKKVISILLSLCIIISFASCGNDIPDEDVTDNSSSSQIIDDVSEEIKALSLNKECVCDYEWHGDSSVMLVRSEYTDVTLDKSLEKQYPLLAKVLSETSVMRKRAMEDEKDNYVAFASEAYKNDSESFSTYVSTLDVQVRRADGVAVSILEDYFSDGCRDFNGINYDSESGKELVLSDVFTDVSKIPATVEKELLSRLGENKPSGASAVIEYFKNTSDDSITWVLDYNGVTFYFNPGDIAPTNFGIQTVTVTFAEYPDLFRQKYTAVPDEYIVSLPLMSSFFTDLTYDGRSEELVVSGNYDTDDGYYYTLAIFTEYADYEVDWIACDLQPYYVRTADGGKFLYVFSASSTEEERQMILSVFRLNDGEVKQVCEKNIGLLYNDDNSFAVPTSPDKLMLYDYDDNLPLLNFMVSEDGIPISK